MGDLDRFFTLVRVETRWFEELDAHLHREHGLRMGSFDVLRVIDSIDGCRVQDIVREIGITVGAVSKSVDRLEAAGWVERRPNPADRRSSTIALTDVGADLLARAVPFVAGEVSARFAALDPSTQRALDEALGALRATFTAG